MEEKKDKILVVDSGSTGIRAIIFNKEGKIIERSYMRTPAETPSPGIIEHDPHVLFDALKKVVSDVIKKSQSQISTDELRAMGITNQRASFCLWDRKTGEPLINFINWADTRSAEVATKMNKNKTWRMLKRISKIISSIIPSPMMKATSLLNFTTDHATVRLKWVFEENPELLSRAYRGEICFGTLDSWYIYKLTAHSVHSTDYSNAAATGMFNPFQLKWNDVLCKIFHIPLSIFPEVKPSNAYFGEVSPELFGISLPIYSAIADQSSALFGHRCFTPGEVKISQGSGAFVDCLMGNKPKLSKRGLFPMIAWNLGGKTYYMLEGYVATAGTLIDWLGQGIGLSDTPKVLNEFAAQCNDTEGVLFIPTPAGIRYPYFNPHVKGSILGLSLSTHRRHVARAVLEGIALRLYEILEGIEKDTGIKIQAIKVDGGVSRSDILVQLLADFSKREVLRAPEPDMTATGAAFLAGLGSGLWKNLHEIENLQLDYKRFQPKMDEQKRQEKIKQWKKAISAILDIYS